jgi:hypothetical protein
MIKAHLAVIILKINNLIGTVLIDYWYRGETVLLPGRVISGSKCDLSMQISPLGG